MRFLYVCYAFLIVTGATMLNYRQADGWNSGGYNSSSGSGSRLGSGTFGSSHK
jgi:hypothetical protein